jgi:hypothetical protein
MECTRDGCLQRVDGSVGSFRGSTHWSVSLGNNLVTISCKFGRRAGERVHERHGGRSSVTSQPRTTTPEARGARPVFNSAMHPARIFDQKITKKTKIYWFREFSSAPWGRTVAAATPQRIGLSEVKRVVLNALRTYVAFLA